MIEMCRFLFGIGKMRVQNGHRNYRPFLVGLCPKLSKKTLTLDLGMSISVAENGRKTSDLFWACFGQLENAHSIVVGASIRCIETSEISLSTITNRGWRMIFGATYFIHFFLFLGTFVCVRSVWWHKYCALRFSPKTFLEQAPKAKIYFRELFIRRMQRCFSFIG